MGWDSFGVVRFDLGPLLQGQLKISQTYNCLELAYYWSYKFGMVNKLQEIMGWEFFCVVGFDFGPPPSRSNKDSQT